MFGLHHFGRRIEPQALGMTAKIGDRDEQVERLASRQQPLSPRRFGHHVQSVEDHVQQPLAPERRLEPARSDEAQQFGLHLLALVGIDRAIDRDAFLGSHPRDRRGPEFGHARFGRLIGVEQRIGVGIVQPHVGQRLERLSGGDRLRQEHAVDPARAGARDDVDQNAQANAGLVFDILKQSAIDALAAGCRRIAIGKRAAGGSEPPDFLGDAVHIDGQADPAVADQR